MGKGKFDINVEENKEIKESENILKYTNGEYLTAPYDCVIISSNLSEVEGQCTNQHYVQISSTQRLAVQVNVSEDYINEIEVGDIANIAVATYDNLEVKVMQNLLALIAEIEMVK